MSRTPRIAIAADIMHVMGGAERVTLAISELYPDAPIYTPVYNQKALGNFFGGKKIVTSYLQKWQWLPVKAMYTLLPRAVESFDFNNFDIVISSSNSYIKNLLTNPTTLHISYIHSPMRFIWDATHTYINSQRLIWPLNSLVASTLHNIRLWDAISVSRVDYYIANSNYVKERIRKFYRRDAQVIYPPVDVDKIAPSHENNGHFLFIARLSQYKYPDLVVQACNELNLPLVVVGTGAMEQTLKHLAGPTVKITGWITDEEKIKYLRTARALIFPADEDFGIVPVEAQAAGKPVIAYRKGGLLETVIDGKTGIFFPEQTVASIKQAIQEFIARAGEFDSEFIAQHAQQFNRQRFQTEIKQLVDKLWEHHGRS